MNKSRRLILAILFLVTAPAAASSIVSLAQKKTKVPVCKAEVLAAFKLLPKLKYQCAADLADYDQKVLKQPNRIKAIKALERRLETFAGAAWWQASVDDLNYCELRRKPGVLSKEEQEKIRIDDYTYDLFGDHSVRLALLPDPCYYIGYGGANAFLLYRQAGKVTVTQVLDGFSSRADNAVHFSVAKLNGQKLIEISTWTGGLHPSTTNYYFAINPKMNRVVPKKLFKGDKGLTNEISSALLMSDPEEVGLPKDAKELDIIRGHKLAPAFSVYVQDDEGKLDTLRGKDDEDNLKMERPIL